MAEVDDRSDVDGQNAREIVRVTLHEWTLGGEPSAVDQQVDISVDERSQLAAWTPNG